MISKYLIAGGAFAAASLSMAFAAPMMVGGVDFDTDNAASDVLWAQGGRFAGPDDKRRSACDDPTDRTSTVRTTELLNNDAGTTCRAFVAQGFNLDDAVELDDNNGNLIGSDVLSAFFDKPLINGDGFDVIIFESLNQDDASAITLFLNGAQIVGTVLGNVSDGMGNMARAVAFDFSDAPLNVALGAAIGAPIYIQTLRLDGNNNPDPNGEPEGSADIVAIVGLNFADPLTDVPLPAAAPIFLLGLAGLGWARKRRKA